MSEKSEHSEIYEFGERIVKLGRAMQDAGTSISTLAQLASDCGLSFQVRVVPNKPEDKETGG